MNEFILVGLGNPGVEYENTRHNAGFLLTDFLRERWSFPSYKTQASCEFTSGLCNNQKVVLVRPLKFMNVSGPALQEFLNYFKYDLSNVVICYDDVDLPLGELRFRDSGSAGTHNGMKSLIEQFGTEKIQRLRLGIESRPEEAKRHGDLSHFVLSPFSLHEKELLASLFGKAEKTVLELIEKKLA